jgi:hypothetical protein
VTLLAWTWIAVNMFRQPATQPEQPAGDAV